MYTATILLRQRDTVMIGDSDALVESEAGLVAKINRQ